MQARGRFHRVSVALAKRAQSGSISVEQPGGKPMNQDDEGRKPERKSAATASSGSSPRGGAKPLAGRSKLREKGSKRGTKRRKGIESNRKFVSMRMRTNE